MISLGISFLSFFSFVSFPPLSSAQCMNNTEGIKYLYLYLLLPSSSSSPPNPSSSPSSPKIPFNRLQSSNTATFRSSLSLSPPSGVSSNTIKPGFQFGLGLLILGSTKGISNTPPLPSCSPVPPPPIPPPIPPPLPIPSFLHAPLPGTPNLVSIHIAVGSTSGLRESQRV
ncbi:hypothetical protein EV361DRAFT_150098 [Lentinula raphanica]|nr:hypothetical protein EV361DRAFT_150098 [Lentinula raphanica]